jgi:hypothetical protein
MPVGLSPDGRKTPRQYYPIYEDEKGSYILNAKDLCMTNTSTGWQRRE